MKLNTEIVDCYLAGNNIEKFKEHWIYKSIGKGEFKGKNIFVKPDLENSEKIKRIYDEIKQCLMQFEPFNRELWDKLFKSWNSILESVEVYLIVGLPEPNDATVIKNPDGNNVVVLDLGCWAKYIGKYDITQLVRNLLTHECGHICIQAEKPIIDMDYESGDYLKKLNSLIFNEGLAHLLSFCEDINSYDWNNVRISEVKAKSLSKLKQAIQEVEKEKQELYIYDAEFGDYYEKFGCMIGMCYFIDIYKSGTIGDLVKDYIDGHKTIISKILDFYI
ncbi:hypothetical protein JHL18_16035 [Clostridium sp. YIM B02505]|uniref:DUF2268 domain-containing protein n=1 Tax=Clostridium yunnanense TaxID=2800325 RepID=A0ABS1ES50_9CLOT|nr:DUF5700 domain-containing putative Zn-dependent protease [Clostridium yunnanense]MBK1812133.1 hypothetical protein [Clostridium yunnanense]